MRARKSGRALASVLAAGCALPLVLSACGGEKPADKPASAAPATEAVQKPQADFSGVVRGIVKLAPDMELPLGPEPNPVPRAAAACPPYSAEDRKVFTLAPETRGLSPVHVALTQMTAVPPYEPTTRELTLDACRVQPALTGAVVGDTLRVVNHSEAALLPVLPGDAYMTSIAKGDKREVKLTGFGPVRVSCGLSGYCGEAIVIALSHPLFAVTSAAGEFEIKGVPLEQDLIVHAAHPFIGVTSTPVRLTKAEPVGTVELVLTPRKAPSPAPVAADQKAEKRAGKRKATEFEPPK